MKNILELTGVQKLSKQQQRNIKGAMASISCCGRNKCRISYAGGSFCEPGRCNRWGQCILY
ncbi:hypothetical protein IWQ47_003861 [Aquimarina sp. EL_43]|uniref:hypothetical protein n=1 Tax=Aquimarina TaxID=290174 RepID=UPI0004B4C7E1|nr:MULTISPECIES: hypothetical protein [Aquimarina]MBG6132636.1 hypothetical protein [Aquimarina sp. EL_35]MBG6152767.1 hypothetical protein [Aquimarina sp. EL_32]MBG6170774.1 hypothetical protein [Aquimarina sp. EL_43]